MASKAHHLGWVGAVLGALCSVILPAQTARIGLSSAAGLPATADAVISEMAAVAGVIFAGQVIAVRAPAGYAGGGVVEVDFRVDQAVRGPAVGAVYTLREWAGLWNAAAGRGRYRVGQRLLIFLYAPDANGLSSPVHGLDGAVPLRGGGTAPGPDDATAAAAQWMVDLRWVETQAVRSDAVLTIPVRGPVVPHPISPAPRPISDQVADPVSDDRVRMGTEPGGALRRRVSAPSPTAVAPPEAQPLAQIIELCQETMGQPALRRIDASR